MGSFLKKYIYIYIIVTGISMPAGIIMYPEQCL